MIDKKIILENDVWDFEKEISTIDIKIKNKKDPTLIDNISPQEISDLDEMFFSNFRKSSSAEGILHGPDNLYSSEFVKLLKDTLGPSKDFVKSSKKNREKVQDKVNSLFYIENQFKTYHKKVEHTPPLLLTILSKEFFKFSVLYKQMVEAKSTNTKVNSKYYSTKVLKFTTYLMESLKDNPTLFTDEEKSLLNESFYLSVLESFQPKDLFMLLCSSAVRIAYQNLIDKKFPDLEDRLDTDNIFSNSSHLQLLKHELLLIVEQRLLRAIVSAVIAGLKDLLKIKCQTERNSIESRIKIIEEELGTRKSTIEEQENIKLLKQHRASLTLPEDYLSNKLTVVIRLLKKEHSYIETHKVYNTYVSACHSLLDVFCESVPVKTKPVTKKEGPGKILSKVVLEMPKGMNQVYSFSDHLPSIIPPENWDQDGYNGTKSLIKYIHLGTSEVTYDSKTILAINRTQKKKFKINALFVNMLRELDNAPVEKTSGLNLPFKTIAEIRAKTVEVENMQMDLPLSELKYRLTFHILIKEKLDASNSKKKFDREYVKNKTNEILEISDFEKVMHETFMDALKELKTMKAKKQIFYTMLEMGVVFMNFPLYFETFSDYRGRMYPLFYLFSRTTGFYKYFLKDYDKGNTLTSRGMIRMLEAYYSINEKETLKFKTHLFNQKSENDLCSLHSYFKKNIMTLEEKAENFLYFDLLEREIDALPLQKYKTDFVLEIDQKSSSSTFLSLILGNKEMARLSNLLGGEASDINNYLQSKTREFISSDSFIKNAKNDEGKPLTKEDISTEKIIQLFEKERKYHKMSFMCFCYSQASFGRAKQWIDLSKGQELSAKEEKALWIFSHKYDEFLNECFSNFKPQLDALKDCYEFFNQHSNETSIRTLDGSVLKWTFYLQKKTTGSRYNSVTDRTQNYKRTTPFSLISSEKDIKGIENLLREMKKVSHSSMNDDAKLKYFDKLNKLKKQLKDIKMSQKSLRQRKASAFRPGLVHSLDAAVVRLLINSMFEKYGYDINHLHDSIQCHPNFVDSLYQEIKLVYGAIAKVNISELFTRQAENSLSEQNLNIFKEKVKFLEKLKEHPVIDPINFKPENMYPFEK